MILRHLLVMMVRYKQADGVLGGVAVPYAETLRPALKVLGKDSKSQVISGSMSFLSMVKHIS